MLVALTTLHGNCCTCTKYVYHMERKRCWRGSTMEPHLSLMSKMVRQCVYSFNKSAEWNPEPEPPSIPKRQIMAFKPQPIMVSEFGIRCN